MPDMHGPKKTTPEVASPASTPVVPARPETVPPVQPQNPPHAVGAASVKNYDALAAHGFLLADHRKVLHLDGWAGRPLIARVVVEGDQIGTEGQKVWGEPGTPLAIPGLVKPGIAFYDASAPIDSTTPFGEPMGDGIYIEGILKSDAPLVGLLLEKRDHTWKVPAEEVRKALRFAIETCDRVIEGWRDHISQDVIDLKVGVPSFKAIREMSDERLVEVIEAYGQPGADNTTAHAALDRMLREACDRDLCTHGDLDLSPVAVPSARFDPEGWTVDVECSAFRGLRLDAGAAGLGHFVYLTLVEDKGIPDEAHGPAVASIRTPDGWNVGDFYFCDKAIACEKAARKALDRIKALASEGADGPAIQECLKAELRSQGWECSKDWNLPASTEGSVQ
jgi:hypothetical protein